MNHRKLHSLATLCVVVVALLSVTMGSPHVARGDLVVKLPDVVVVSDGFNPTFSVIEVALTYLATSPSDPPSISSFNLNIDVAGSGIALGLPQQPAADPMNPPLPLFEGGSFSSSSTGINVKAAHDIFSESPSSVPAFNGARLINIPFVVDGGVLGSFPLTFGALNQFANASASALPVTFLGGSILVAPVPEAEGWLLMAAAGVVAASVAAVRRRDCPRS